jgi:NADH-quinone oxidoreductase subunit J
LPTVTAESVFFFLLAAFAVTTAVLMVLQRSPVMSAVCLIGNFFALAGLYLLLRAQLLAVLQIVVYTGAIMVLVVFVIMLLNLGDEERLREKYDLRMAAVVILAAGFIAELAYILAFSGDPSLHASLPPAAGVIGTVEAMGAAMFSTFILPFEATSLLLLTAIVGAVVLAKKKD